MPSTLALRRLWNRFDQFEPMPPHELALVAHVVDEVVAQIRRMRGDAPMDADRPKAEIGGDALTGFIDIG